MRTPLLLAAACTGLVLLAGCGDDGSTAAGDAEGSDTPSTSTSASPSDTPTSEDPTEPSSGPTDGPNGSPSADPTTDPAADLPACGQVWVAGQDLPAQYDGCQQDGTAVPADSRECAFGRPLVVYGDRFYAVPGAVVNRTAGPVRRDGAYREALQSCSG